MAKNRVSGEPTVRSNIYSEPLRKLKDPLPWLISTLRQQQEQIAEGPQRTESHPDTKGTA